MSIDEYFAQIELVISSFPLNVSYILNIDRKTDEILFISGTIHFRDGSTLDFKEFLEEMELVVEKYKYGYNYRKGSNLLFRYDNANDPRAKKLLSFPHHKHTESGTIVESKEMNLKEVLEEIEGKIISNWE